MYLIVSNCKTDNYTEIQLQNSEVDTTLLFGTWAFEKTDPHAVFEINKYGYISIDHPENGSIPYKIENKRIEILFPDHVQWGEISFVGKDSLGIYWLGTTHETKYVRFSSE